MKPAKLHLSDPFGQVLASLLALPSTHAEMNERNLPETAGLSLRKGATSDAEVKEALRSLYEAAHGRQVETQIGFIAIAPPIAGFLKETPYFVTTQHEFFLEAFTRILAGDSQHQGGTSVPQTPGGKRATNDSRMHARTLAQEKENRNTFFSHKSPRFSNN